jgi:hypothetical protein
MGPAGGGGFALERRRRRRRCGSATARRGLRRGQAIRRAERIFPSTARLKVIAAAAAAALWLSFGHDLPLGEEIIDTRLGRNIVQVQIPTAADAQLTSN